MGYLLSRQFGRKRLRLYFMFSVFINTDRNKRGQTCYLVTGAQIQTSCNFDSNVTSSIPLAKIYLVDGFPCLSCAILFINA